MEKEGAVRAESFMVVASLVWDGYPWEDESSDCSIHKSIVDESPRVAGGELGFCQHVYH